jgi:hypothetical protein
MRNMLLERKIQVEVHSARFSIKSITSSNLHMWISNLYLPRKTMNCQNRITRSLKFIFKNSSVVPRSQKPTKDHESYLSTRVNISTLMLINVVKNPLLQSNKKNSVIKLEGTGQSHTWVAWTQSHNTWRAVSTPLPRCR